MCMVHRFLDLVIAATGSAFECTWLVIADFTDPRNERVVARFALANEMSGESVFPTGPV
jgi:hypothetical protein